MKKILKERKEKLFNKLFENQGIKMKELDIPQKAAHLAMVDTDDVDEVELSGGGEARLDKSLDRADSVMKSVDTKEEMKAMLKSVIEKVKAEAGEDLAPREIVGAIRMVLKDMAEDAKMLAKDIATMKQEAHVVISPESDDEKKKELSEEEEKGNPWAICTASVGRDDEEKYERCVKAVKKQK